MSQGSFHMEPGWQENMVGFGIFFLNLLIIILNSWVEPSLLNMQERN